MNIKRMVQVENPYKTGLEAVNAMRRMLRLGSNIVGLSEESIEKYICRDMDQKYNLAREIAEHFFEMDVNGFPEKFPFEFRRRA